MVQLSNRSRSQNGGGSTDLWFNIIEQKNLIIAGSELCPKSKISLILLTIFIYFFEDEEKIRRHNNINKYERDKYLVDRR
jgi:hypothetical protein